MKRRNVLRTGAAAGALALAGCLASGGPAGPGDGTETDGPGGNGTDGTTTTDGGGDGGDGDVPALGEVGFEILDAGCGVERNAATVRTDDDAGEVVVEGTIAAPSACYTASLAETVYGSTTDSAWVDVVTERRPDAQACAQCITEIEYRATLPFEGGLPGRVAVTHDGSLVCSGGGPAADDGGNATDRGNVTDGTRTA